jgi:class 3 adenylate cyclase
MVTDHLRYYSAVLFTDTVGSFGFKTENGDAAYAEVNRRHNELFRELITQSNGKIADKVGDEYLALFQAPSDAVEMALRFQHALAHTPAQMTQSPGDPDRYFTP